MTKLTFRSRVLLWFTIASSILILMGYVGFTSIHKVEQQKKWVDHTFIVLDCLKEILANAKDLQLAHRGYVITGEQNYLLPYTMAEPKILGNVAKLDDMLADNPVQMKRLETLRLLVQGRINSSKSIIDTYDSQGQAAAFQVIRTGRGIKEMVELSNLISEMVAEENMLLAQRQAVVSEATASALRTGAIGLILCVAILIFVFRIIWRETEKREETEKSLQITLDDMARFSRENELLGKMSDYLKSCQSPEEAFGVIGKFIPNLFPGTQGAIFTFRHSRNSLETSVSWGENSFSNSEFAPDECWALRRGQFYSYFPSSTEACCGHVDSSSHRSYICLPLMVHGDIIGLLHIQCATGDPASLDKRDLMRRVGEQIALAIGNLTLQMALREQSIRDPLTHLFNRRYLETTLERELSRARRNKQPISVLVMDIDHFKKFNDSMGHDAGDALLTHFARLLEKNIRKEDIACRYGGEEFVVVLPMANNQQGIDRAQKIIEATRLLRVQLNNKELMPVTVSIGVSSYPEHDVSVADLISLADAALYKAKNAGRDQVISAS